MRSKAVLILAVMSVGWLAAGAEPEPAAGKVKVLLIDGQNNHNWQATTPVLKKILEDSGRFTVDVATSPPRLNPPQKPKDSKDEAAAARYKEALAKFNEAQKAYKQAMARFHPDLSRYYVVLSNYNGDSWPPELQKDLEERLKEGKIGLVIVHAANNSFGGWKEYNLMIGMGWRGKGFGERLKLDENGKEIHVPKGEDLDSGHRTTGKWPVVIRNPEHPVTKGMPREWMHNNDELYDNMRGPIQNVKVLATAYSKGAKAHEPMIWTVDYGKGRVFHTPMGHDVNAMKCVGFAVTVSRGTEWAATGKVSIPIPKDFPTEKEVRLTK
jgi:type 1 glutamine amidotransferase